MGAKPDQPKHTLNYTPGPGMNIRLRGKKLANGKISLYLDYYKGYSRNKEGKLLTKRYTEYLKIYLLSSPKSQEDRRINKENLDLAQKIRTKRESDLNHNSEGFISPQKKKVNFLDFCEQYKKTYTKGDPRMIHSAIEAFKGFISDDFISASSIDKSVMEKFRDHLLSNYNGETPNSYFKRFKKVLNAAVQEGLLSKSPAEGIRCAKPDGIPKAILMPEEIIKLAKTQCGNPEVKRAFLFSLNTGLRFIDIKDLRYKHIQNAQVVKPQTKTGKTVYIDLNSTALKLIGKIEAPEALIFDLPSLDSCLRTIKTWTKRASIEKNITWHSARHSFATILLMNNANIKTVSGLLGHSKLDHTQKYTHLVDELKKKAVDSLPDINL
ncbi:site-specific integrase [Mangrovibacterium diazotrophicum]|uniref:Site-specific recombinase XerD n=1 Tax=Mangrovibacterium diazotrophicum TaxID=1261403 RepID=A0A419W4P1_9BACT|nr:site-specific integrase [Mangrovibacterium diazotrophicum]RKD90415.1 site-specific recombinase XerD [Mangrovibacterium diazotrophicum]